MLLPDPIFAGRVDGGRLQIENWHVEAFERWKQRFEGDAVQVIVRAVPKRPSHDMHKYYRGVLLPMMAHEQGMADLEMHRVLTAAEYIPVDVERTDLGARSTADLTMAEYAEFINLVSVRGAFCGIYLPDPGEMAPAAGIADIRLARSL